MLTQSFGLLLMALGFQKTYCFPWVSPRLCLNHPVFFVRLLQQLKEYLLMLFIISGKQLDLKPSVPIAMANNG